MKLIRWLCDKIAALLLTTILLPFAVSLVSKVKTGHWLGWFKLTLASWWIVFGFGLGMLAWAVVTIVRRRIIRLREPCASTGVFIPPPFGWLPMGELLHAGVVWRVRAHAPDPLGASDANEIDLSTIEAEVPPRCSQCGTEIEESRSFWGGYLWRCVSCRFKKRHRNSYYREQKRVAKIAKRRLEKTHLEE